MPHQDVLQRFAHVLMLLSQGAISIEENNFMESIFRASRALRERLTARIESMDWPQKKICWMKKIWREMAWRSLQSMRIARITRITWVIRDRISEPEFRF